MGGRGSRSVSGTGQVVEGRGGSVDLEGLMIPDGRSDIQTMFGEIGFKGVYGTDDMDTAVLGAYGIQLNQLERKFGAVSSTNTDVGMTRKADFVAAVSYEPTNPANQTLIFNLADMGSIKNATSQQRESEKAGWSMKTDGSLKSHARYTVTHEYGHILHNALYTRARQRGYRGTRDQFVNEASKKISDIARGKYGGRKSGGISEYGKTNSREFFAEAFASSQLGKPNAVGMAMSDWLTSQGF